MDPENDKEARQARRVHLTDRLHALRQRLYSLESELNNYTQDFYRVCIFGSARIKPEDIIYKTTFEVAAGLGELGIDVLTGGGPGLMEAANRGVLSGRQNSGSSSKSFGITIELNKFESPSEHLDIKHHHKRFSSRLDDFMRLSNAVVVVQGGIGTLLELYFTWQLLQVGHMPERPFILMDKGFWQGLIDWMQEQQAKNGLVSPGDFRWLHLVDTPEEALDILRDDYEQFLTKRNAAAEFVSAAQQGAKNKGQLREDTQKEQTDEESD